MNKDRNVILKHFAFQNKIRNFNLIQTHAVSKVYSNIDLKNEIVFTKLLCKSYNSCRISLLLKIVSLRRMHRTCRIRHEWVLFFKFHMARTTCVNRSCSHCERKGTNQVCEIYVRGGVNKNISITKTRLRLTSESVFPPLRETGVAESSLTHTRAKSKFKVKNENNTKK